jgi:hypothetical protein
VRADVQKPDLRHTASGERANDRKPISIKGAGCKFGGCVRKAVELTSGDLPFVPESGLRVERSILTGRQKSAAGVVVRQRTKAQTVLRKEGNGSGE